MRPSTEPKVSFQIPVLNEEKTLGNCLDAIKKIKYPQEKIEIIIAAGPSTDSTDKIIKQYKQKYDNIIIYENPSGNTAVGRNICTEKATGEYVICYSGHVIAQPNFLKETVLRLHQSKDTTIAAVGCANKTPGKQSYIGKVAGVAFSSIMGGKNFFNQNASYDKECYVDHISIACYKKKIVEEVGGYDPIFWCGQDAELDVRIKKAGYKILFTPKTHVEMFKRETIKKLFAQMYRYGIARAKIIKKHHNPKPVHFLGPTFILGIIVILFLSFLKLIPLIIFPLLIMLYFISSIISSLLVKKDFFIACSSPLIYLIIHIGYGLGFLRGLMPGKFKKPDR